MSEPDYTPFPEAALASVVTVLDSEAIYYRDRGDAKEHSHWLECSVVCRDALLSFAALRERCLLAETENAQLKRRLSASSSSAETPPNG